MKYQREHGQKSVVYLWIWKEFVFNNSGLLLNFFEVDRLEQLTSLAVIKKLTPHLARFGIPNTLVTDNGPQFISDNFRDFSMKYQFDHITTSSNHHQSNGKAESAVKQAKRIIRTCKSSNDDIYFALLVFRNTQTNHETSPVQRLFNRRAKTPLPVSEKLFQPKINPQSNASNKDNSSKRNTTIVAQKSSARCGKEKWWDYIQPESAKRNGREG
jgi:hypothetical protein